MLAVVEGLTISSEDFGSAESCAESPSTTASMAPTPSMPTSSDVIVDVSPHSLDASFDTCALVGSSTNLVDGELGKEIDKHDLVVRVNRLPIARYFRDFGQKTDVFFAHDKNVQESGLSVQFMDGEWRNCSSTPTT